MVKVKDLYNVGDDDSIARSKEYLFCTACGYKWGGTQGDYWDLGDEHIFTCPECDSDAIALVEDVVTHRIVKA